MFYKIPLFISSSYLTLSLFFLFGKIKNMGRLDNGKRRKMGEALSQLSKVIYQGRKNEVDNRNIKGSRIFRKTANL